MGDTNCSRSRRAGEVPLGLADGDRGQRRRDTSARGGGAPVQAKAELLWGQGFNVSTLVFCIYLDMMT